MKRNMSEEEKQKRTKVREFLKQNPISSPSDLNTFFKDMKKFTLIRFLIALLLELQTKFFFSLKNDKLDL